MIWYCIAAGLAYLAERPLIGWVFSFLLGVCLAAPIFYVALIVKMIVTRPFMKMGE